MLLNERESGGSLDFEPYLGLLESKGFNIAFVNDENMRLWTDNDNVNQKAKYLFTLLKHCGWVCSSHGGYYDGLRNQAKNIADSNGVSEYGVYIFNIEKEYPSKLSNDFKEIRYSDEWNLNRESDPTYDIHYIPDVLWHLTLRRYLPRIMKNGLIPKNGNVITAWRNTGGRVYLSLLPELDKVTWVGDEEERDNDDFILLKVNIAPIKDRIPFYKDYAYENAVFTTEAIPPQLISVVSDETINAMVYETELAQYINDNLDVIRKHNPGYDISDILSHYKWYAIDVIKKLYPTKNFIGRIDNDTINKTINRVLKRLDL